MIKAFLFDYDGVITAGVDVKLPEKRLVQNLGIPAEKASELIVSVWKDYSTGVLSLDEVWAKFEADLGVQIPEAKRDIWYGWEELQPLPFMLDYVKELKASGYAAGLVSNVFKEAAKLIRENGGYDDFDFTVLSCEVGARKPDPRIYHAALQHLPGVHPEEVVYLDDREPLTQAAAQLGMHSIYVTDQAKAIAQIKQLLG